MVINDFKFFVIGSGVNVLLQVDYEVLFVLVLGFFFGKVLLV